MSDNSLYQYFTETSPYNRSKEALEKRDYYFYTHRRRTPGLMSRLSVGFIALMTLYGAYAIKKTRSERERGKVVAYEFKRKSLPFLQAIEDRRYLAMVQRQQWLVEELFKDRPEELKALQRFYNDPMMWPGTQSRGFPHFGGVQKSYKGMARMQKDFWLGHDSYRQNLPGTHF